MSARAEDLEFLAHHGVKGMKWGVRRDRRLHVLERASSGEGNKATTLRALARLGPVDLVKGRGIKGGAGRKLARISSSNERVRAGEGRVRDKIRYYGGTRMSDFAPVRDKNVNKKSTAKRDTAVVAGVGALFVANLLVKSAARSV